MEDMKQKAVCQERYKKKVDEERGNMSELDLEREQECGICMETNTKIALPDCNHAMCLKCYREWYSSSSSQKLDQTYCLPSRGLNNTSHVLSTY